MTHKERIQRRKDIAAAIADGGTIADACTKFGVCRHTVYDACIAHNTPLPRNARVNQKCDPYTVLAHLQSSKKYSLNEISRLCGITRARVSQLKALALEAGVLVDDRDQAGDNATVYVRIPDPLS